MTLSGNPLRSDSFLICKEYAWVSANTFSPKQRLSWASSVSRIRSFFLASSFKCAPLRTKVLYSFSSNVNCSGVRESLASFLCK